MTAMQPAVFLDRDGVIIENRAGYVRSWEDVEFLPDALQALVQLALTPYAIVIVTNQSVVGRGLLSLEKAQKINQGVIDRILQVHGRVDGAYLCPHAPQDQCDCRKPKPGLLTQAAIELDLDLINSIMIGDALTDLSAAEAAGIQHKILVLTGRGAEQARLPEAKTLFPFESYPSLSAAVQAILEDGPDRKYL
jgi:D-glycero-D-manno-heptose 1,7-bisphosphate phosphatase